MRLLTRSEATVAAFEDDDAAWGRKVTGINAYQNKRLSPFPTLVEPVQQQVAQRRQIGNPAGGEGQFVLHQGVLQTLDHFLATAWRRCWSPSGRPAWRTTRARRPHGDTRRACGSPAGRPRPECRAGRGARRTAGAPAAARCRRWAMPARRPTAPPIQQGRPEVGRLDQRLRPRGGAGGIGKPHHPRHVDQFGRTGRRRTAPRDGARPAETLAAKSASAGFLGRPAARRETPRMRPRTCPTAPPGRHTTGRCPSNSSGS